MILRLLEEGTSKFDGDFMHKQRAGGVSPRFPAVWRLLYRAVRIRSIPVADRLMMDRVEGELRRYIFPSKMMCGRIARRAAAIESKDMRWFVISEVFRWC